MTNICDQKNFRAYEFPPPEMVRGCEAFTMNWAEVIE